MNFSCFSFETCTAHWVGQLWQEWEGKFLSSLGNHSFSQLSNVWASARPMSQETLPWKGYYMELMFLRKQSQNSEMLFQMLFMLIRLKHGSSRDRTATVVQGSLQKEYRLMPQIQRCFRRWRSCIAALTASIYTELVKKG